MTGAICSASGVGFAPLLACVNEITLGIFGAFLLGSLWLLIYFRNRTDNPKTAVVGASWITFLVAVLLRVAGGVTDTQLGFVFVLAVGSLALLMFTRQ